MIKERRLEKGSEWIEAGHRISKAQREEEESEEQQRQNDGDHQEKMGTNSKRAERRA